MFPLLLYWLYYANNGLLVQREEIGTFLCFKEVFGGIHLNYLCFNVNRTIRQFLKNKQYNCHMGVGSHFKLNVFHLYEYEEEKKCPKELDMSPNE